MLFPSQTDSELIPVEGGFFNENTSELAQELPIDDQDPQT